MKKKERSQGEGITHEKSEVSTLVQKGGGVLLKESKKKGKTNWWVTV